jgi:hypothetical protein
MLKDFRSLYISASDLRCHHHQEYDRASTREAPHWPYWTTHAWAYVLTTDDQINVSTDATQSRFQRGHVWRAKLVEPQWRDLARMALDYLTIPAMSAEPERVQRCQDHFVGP